MECQPSSGLEKLKQLFRKYDTNHTGAMEKDQLFEIMQTVCRISYRDLDMLLLMIPGRDFESIGYEEFLDFVFIGGWQVRTDRGWYCYDSATQASLRAAAWRGEEQCEVYVPPLDQYFTIDLVRLAQINPVTEGERTVRLVGDVPLPPRPKLEIERLVAELRQVEASIAAGLENGLRRCEPMDKNLLEWEVDISFAAGSALQNSLDQLVASSCDESFDRITLCIRFPARYPVVQPEVWIRRPRMQPSFCGAAVTFGGRVCSPLLTSEGWRPESTMIAVLEDVRQTLLAAGVVAEPLKKEYPTLQPQLQRLSTELFITANGFSKDGVTVLSPVEAAPFLGNLARLELTDKICLPQRYANEIYKRSERGAQLKMPLTFEIKTLHGRKRHCAILEFMDELPEMHVLVPRWVMEDLGIEERDAVRVRGVDLDLISSVKVQPHSADFYHAVRDSGQDVLELLTNSLSRFSALTEDTSVPIDICGKLMKVHILQCEPHGAVRIIDTDMDHHFEFKVDFEPAPDLEDELAMQESRKRVEAAEQELIHRRMDARQKRFEDLRIRAQQGSGIDDGREGIIETALRMPDGSQVKGKFREGAPITALICLALESKWAQASIPWGVRLRMSFPPKFLGNDDVISNELHRAAVLVQEEQAPENDDELFAVFGNSSNSRCETSSKSETTADATCWSAPPKQDQDSFVAETQRAFHMQHFLSAGFSIEEAAAKLAAGDMLPPAAVRKRSRPRRPTANLRGADAPTAREPERLQVDPDEREGLIEEVICFTGADRAVAEGALEESGWVTERAVNLVLDSFTE
eukprot:TRINITY_DN29084_c0_g1_i1.p1 TRINITY_DN29084_c0_g1~~TRINITY_DN29084_c0_g1_i1.p1  ORF type:complete len:806 (-),score=147.74 TRINITY_DN29084_c0_g1_i1:208-2625(-)